MRRSGGGLEAEHVRSPTLEELVAPDSFVLVFGPPLYIAISLPCAGVFQPLILPQTSVNDLIP
jgi:hypothetical protein